jgi:hypothetical protein
MPEYLAELDYFKLTFNTMKKGDLIPGLDFTEQNREIINGIYQIS